MRCIVLYISATYNCYSSLDYDSESVLLKCMLFTSNLVRLYDLLYLLYDLILNHLVIIIFYIYLISK